MRAVHGTGIVLASFLLDCAPKPIAFSTAGGGAVLGAPSSGRPDVVASPPTTPALAADGPRAVDPAAACRDSLPRCRPEHACGEDAACPAASRCAWGCCTPLAVVGCEVVVPSPITWKGRRSFDLTRGSLPTLDVVADTLLRFEDAILAIDAHDASTGAEKYSRIPTQKRADAIRDYLMRRGVPGERLVARGWESERPIDTNATAAGRARNRRVELLLSVAPECGESLGTACGPVAPK